MKIRVAVCQVDMEWEHTARNLERLEPIVAAADADIAVLPEMFATGFKLRPARVAEPADGLVASTMRRWAAQYGKAVVGSVVIAENGEFRNRMFFVKPSGGVAWYDKRHLFRPGGEARDYTPGDRRVVVEYMGFRFLLLICYDLRFPVWSRNRGDYDAILCSASWADDRREVWRTLLRARAIENQCYLAGVTAWAQTPMLSMRAIRRSSTSVAPRWPMPVSGSRPSSPNSTPMRRRPSARSSRRGWMPTASS